MQDIPAKPAGSRGYRIRPPLVKPTRITENGWVINYAVGCSHGCIFCYADSIHKRFNPYRLDTSPPWGHYFYTPCNLWQAIVQTPWHRWAGEEVLMSSIHDPYLPQLARYTRAILERALKAGVRIRILTRSTLILKDMDLLERYRDRVIVQVSIATMDPRFARLIEPRVPSPEKRLMILREAKKRGLKTGANIAPIFPPNRHRPWLEEDLESIVARLAEARVDRVYGELLHVRGMNMAYIREALGESVHVDRELDQYVERLFYRLLDEYGLKGEYIREYS